MATTTLARPAAGPKPKHFDDVHVDVTASQGNGEIDWSVEVKTAGHGKGSKVELPDGRGFRITFKLENPDDLDVRFDASDPIYVREGGGSYCPSKLDSKQIMIDRCEAEELEIIDWNFGAARELYYQLNFVTETGGAVNPCDPIITNGGGGKQP
jgi:hypothetical protein